jgi:hypothetical protein
MNSDGGLGLIEFAHEVAPHKAVAAGNDNCRLHIVDRRMMALGNRELRHFTRFDASDAFAGSINHHDC